VAGAVADAGVQSYSALCVALQQKRQRMPSLEVTGQLTVDETSTIQHKSRKRSGHSIESDAVTKRTQWKKNTDSLVAKKQRFLKLKPDSWSP
jgi:hypothetical protein